MTFRLLMAATSVVVLQALPQMAAANVTDRSYCGQADLPTPLRQTLVVVDGRLVQPETEGPAEGNQLWRSFMVKFVNAADTYISQNIAPGELVTLALANPDGSGITPIFNGCVPYFSKEVDQARQSESSTVSTFFGSDWNAQKAKMAASFQDAALMATVSGIADIGAAKTGEAFGESGLALSLSRSRGVDPAYGIPRVILLTDLSQYTFPAEAPAQNRTAGIAAANTLGADFGFADVHLMSTGAIAASSKDYLETFFLQSKAQMLTLAGAKDNMTQVEVPQRVETYMGSIRFPIGDGVVESPLRMRLAVSAGNRVVSSWIEETRMTPRFAPLKGDLNCVSGICDYIGDSVFAQVWSTEPGGEPECGENLPFIGMRNLDFSHEDGVIKGKVSDTVCYLPQAPEGIEFTLRQLQNGNW